MRTTVAARALARRHPVLTYVVLAYARFGGADMAVPGGPPKRAARRRLAHSVQLDLRH